MESSFRVVIRNVPFVAMSVERIATHNKHRGRIITCAGLNNLMTSQEEMYWKKCMSQLKNQLSKA